MKTKYILHEIKFAFSFRKNNKKLKNTFLKQKIERLLNYLFNSFSVIYNVTNVTLLNHFI